jgi:ClpP class serine protease
VSRKIISAGKYKAEGAEGPLSAEGLQAIQERVDAYYESMVKDIARGRNVAQKAVREGFGEGRTFGAARAVKEGMADRVATFDQVVGELVARGRAGGGSKAQAEPAKASLAQKRERDF